MSVRDTIPMSRAVSPREADRGLQVVPMSGALGAELFGIDLSEPLDDASFERVEELLLTHKVLALRDQNINGLRLRDFAQRFGSLATHPAYPTLDGAPEVAVLEYDEENPSKVDSWHADMTFLETPPKFTLLHARIVPEAGGDTLFACMNRAYEALSEPWQDFVCGLRAEHSFAHGFKESLAEPGGYERLREAIDANPPVDHPVLRQHPVTRKRGLYVNEVFTTRIAGMSPAESRAVLEFLFAHCTTPEMTCRVRWVPGTLVIWDNRLTQHRPVNDYWPARRKMHRVVVDGDTRPAQAPK